ncbi:hypothetical protein SAMN06295960_0275 [Paenibacillus aquistagni]|uniref:Uncharacterized protein n=2 Tax=Paenibacillus aquistagni TaxID=1852522 RepID=A0A1X7IAE9_9BACL|nr:hypothetical protein SAMN06295960_0275 [Paenibacillus aquistagni]
MYANFESASHEEKAEMIGKVSSILVPGMGVKKAGKAAKVPEALSSMTQAVKTSQAVNVLSDPLKKLKGIDWRTYANSFQDWTKGLQPGRYAVTPEGMFIRIPDETSSVVRRIDAGDGKKIEGTGKVPSDFADRAKLKGHFDKHGKEFGGLYKNVDEYLEGAKKVINNGIKVKYEYKDEIRTGYVRFMGNNKDGKAKFEFVGTNNNGEITTYHTQSGKKFWKTINGENIPVINPAE